jgi:aminotransferase in exopolysaccharide biosynthesis
MKSYQELLDFIRSTFNEPIKFIPLHDPRFIGNERKYLSECIDSNFVSSVGEFVGRFENLCAKYSGAKYAVAAVNGTSALHVSLKLVGVKQDEEVLTQAISFIATANAISYTGARPVFLDVDKETMGLSPGRVKMFLKENAIVKDDGFPYNKSTGKRIAACVPMHTFGHPVKLKQLQEICDHYRIPLVEDAAESIGSTYLGKHTGTFGKIGVLSFNGNKVITCGGGGMILTDDEEIATKAKHLTTQAKVPHPWNYVHDYIGYNYRLTNLSAALGCGQIEKLDYLLELKRELTGKYVEYFKNSEFNFFIEPEGCKSNYWLNAIIVRDRTQRDEILEFTNSNGVMTRPIWELLNRLPMFENCQTDGLENSIWFADRVINIPSSPIIPGYRKNL